jgi:uncharacterized protein (DUF1330 family)
VLKNRRVETENTLTLCCLLWARDGAAGELSKYEDTVLELLRSHGADIVSRVVGDGEGDLPHEVQIYRFPDAASLDAYLGDPERAALAAWRDRVVARTELFPVRARRGPLGQGRQRPVTVAFSEI